MQGKHDLMAALAIFTVLGLVFFLIDPCFTITMAILGLLAYGYLNSK
jgi:hypothetical protein